MAKLNTNYAHLALGRLEKLTDDATPRWGTMTAAQMVGHLNQVVLYTMGHGPEMPYRGNWKSRYVFRPLIVGQFVKMPRNVRLPRPEGSRGPRVFPEGTLEELRVTLDEYLRRAECRDLPARMHPFFGRMAPWAWQRIHHSHFEHHLAQFAL